MSPLRHSALPTPSATDARLALPGAPESIRPRSFSDAGPGREKAMLNRSRSDPTRSPRLLQATFNPFLASPVVEDSETNQNNGPAPLSCDGLDSSLTDVANLPTHDGKIGTWMLVGLIYYAVSGGPLGLEVAVAAGGPALALLGFIVIPFVWAASEAALTTELSIAYPEASGYCAWLNASFGPYASFVCCSLHYWSGLFDNAIYPVLFVSYLGANEGLADHLSEGEPGRYATVIGFTVAMTYLAWRGLDVNGSACIILTAVVMTPFLVFSVIGVHQVDPSNWLLGPAAPSSDADVSGEETKGDIQWSPLLNCLFWNLNYFDAASCFSGDTREPAKTFPRAMGFAVFAIASTYLIPIAIATGARPRAEYCDGCLVNIASSVAGPWLGVWITCAAAAGCVGLFVADMASNSFQIMGMSDQGQLPMALSARSRYGTPTFPMLIGFVAVLAGSNLRFGAILEVVNVLYIFAQFMQIAALVKLRLDRPNMARPWQVPAKTPLQAFFFFCPAITFLVTVVYFSPRHCLFLLVLVVCLSTIVYMIQCVVRRRNWLSYHDVQDGWGVENDPLWMRMAVAKLDHLVGKYKDYIRLDTTQDFAQLPGTMATLFEPNCSARGARTKEVTSAMV